MRKSCFVDLEKAFDRVLRKVLEWAMRKRGPNGEVEIEGKSGSDGKGEWSEMVQACVEEG